MDLCPDTVCGGSTFELIETTREIVDVGGFHPSMAVLKGVPVGTIITDINIVGETIISVFVRTYFLGKDLQHSLIPLAQLWDNQVVCNITP